MSQSYVETNHRAANPRSLQAQPRAAVAVLHPHAAVGELLHGKAHSKSRAMLAGLAGFMDRRRFVYVLWSSVLLFVAGLALLYRSAPVDGEAWFLLGGTCMIGAAALFRLSRASLIARFESEGRSQGLSDGAAHVRAHELFDQMLVSTHGHAPLPAESGDKQERVLEKLPLA